MESIELYKKHAQPPTWALKEITAGRLRGKTDINPQWRIEALTDIYGLCGFGWRYEVLKKWEVQTGEETLCFVDIFLYVKIGDIWSFPIPGNGGSKMVTKESNGMHNSDECYKMATTDALSVACKQIGIGSNIYTGGKYPTEPQQKPQPTNKDLQEALEQIKIIDDENSLVTLYNQNLKLQKIPEFITALTKRKNELKQR